MGGELLVASEQHGSASGEVDVQRDWLARFEGGLNSGLEVLGQIGRVQAEEPEDIDAHYGVTCEILWVERVDEAGGIEVNEQFVPTQDKILQR